MISHRSQPAVVANVRYKRPRVELMPSHPALRGRYDAVQPSKINDAHWALADSMGPRLSLGPEVRGKLRSFARYEVANNSYAQGIVETLANDAIGNGPRLQMRLPGPPEAVREANRRIERAFAAWAREVQLARKLRTMRMARCVDGESFAVMITNPRLRSRVKLDLWLIEADQVADPQEHNDARNVDGVVLDRHGNPLAYHVLRHHPGDLFAGYEDHDDYAAGDVIHQFTRRRPGQVRGVPDLTPALPLFAQLRRYTLAVITAAETAADVAMWLKNVTQVDFEKSAQIDPEDMMQLVRGAVLALPEGWDIGQMRAEQPTNTYKDFKREILNEIARCLHMPRNIAAADSSGYNYASGRLDHQTYDRSIDVDRDNIATSTLDRVLHAWMGEAILIQDLIPPQFRDPTTWDHAWFWGGREHADPTKQATAQSTRLKNGTTTLAREYAAEGLDWEEQLEQRARERDRMAELGLSPVDAAPSSSTTIAAPDEEEDDDE